MYVYYFHENQKCFCIVFHEIQKCFHVVFHENQKCFYIKPSRTLCLSHKHSVRDVKFLLICPPYNVILITGTGAAGTPTPATSAENEVPVMPAETAPVFPVGMTALSFIFSR